MVSVPIFLFLLASLEIKMDSSTIDKKSIQNLINLKCDRITFADPTDENENINCC